METNLDDVMQIENIFVNVSKGELAKHQDLQKSFGTTETDVIVKEVIPIASSSHWIKQTTDCVRTNLLTRS